MRSLRILALVLLSTATLALTACKPKAETAAPAEPAASTAEATAPAAEAATAPAEEAAMAPAEEAAAGEIGVAACDEYISKWEACLEAHVPAEAREQVKAALDASRASWKQAAATPEGKAGLEAACKQAIEVAQTQVAAYGCTW